MNRATINISTGYLSVSQSCTPINIDPTLISDDFDSIHVIFIDETTFLNEPLTLKPEEPQRKQTIQGTSQDFLFSLRGF